MMSRCTMPSEWMCRNPVSCVCVQYEIKPWTSSSTHRLIQDSKDSLQLHTSATRLLSFSYARSQKLHRHVFEMLDVTVSIHNRNSGLTFKKLQDMGLMPKGGSLPRCRGSRFLDGNLLARGFLGCLVHIALFQCSVGDRLRINHELTKPPIPIYSGTSLYFSVEIDIMGVATCTNE